MAVFDQSTLLVILLILVLGLIVPELFRRLKVPFVTCLLLLGALLGPLGLNYVQSNEILEFLGFLGAAFLLLMAGLEVEAKHFANLKKRIFVMAALNGIIPFIVGWSITKYFGYSWIEALLVGTIFISSSVAIVISAVQDAKLGKKDIGEAIISTAVVLDITSLLILSLILQTENPITKFPLVIYFAILVVSIYVLKKFLPLLAKLFFKHLRRHIDTSRHSEYEDQLHFVLAILIGVLIFFSALGVHPIVAAFVVGLLLSDVMTSKILRHKLHTIAYGLFIPIFFFSMGMQLDLRLIFSIDLTNILMLVIVVGLIASKMISGYISGRLVGFSKTESNIFGSISIAKLTTALAVTYAAAALGILSPSLVSSIVVLTIVTTVLAPILMNHFTDKLPARVRGKV